MPRTTCMPSLKKFHPKTSALRPKTTIKDITCVLKFDGKLLLVWYIVNNENINQNFAFRLSLSEVKKKWGVS